LCFEWSLLLSSGWRPAERPDTGRTLMFLLRNSSFEKSLIKSRALIDSPSLSPSARCFAFYSATIAVSSWLMIPLTHWNFCSNGARGLKLLSFSWPASLPATRLVQP
jgi:hypothetical protein